MFVHVGGGGRGEGEGDVGGVLGVKGQLVVQRKNIFLSIKWPLIPLQSNPSRRVEVGVYVMKDP